jgi:hypothetical protein
MVPKSAPRAKMVAYGNERTAKRGRPHVLVSGVPPIDAALHIKVHGPYVRAIIAWFRIFPGLLVGCYCPPHRDQGPPFKHPPAFIL